MSDWSRDSEDLFAAGRMVDEPSAEDRERVALRIAAQIATGAAVVSLTAAAGTGATSATVGGAAAAMSKVGTGVSLAKVLVSLAIGVSAVGVVTTAVVESSGSRAHVTPVTQVSPMQALPPSSSVSRPSWSQPRASAMAIPPVEDAPVPTSVTVPSAPSVPFPPSAPMGTAVHRTSASLAPIAASASSAALPYPPPPVATAVAPAAARTEDTASEARLVRGIDDALRRHDVSTAQRLLDEHDATFPHGHLGEECAAARVLARCDPTPTEDARQAACTFFSQHPRSPMRARIEEACAPRCDPSR